MSKKVTIMSNRTNTLIIQKNRVKRIAIDYLYCALFILLLDIIVLIVALTLKDKTHANRILYGVIPILSAFCAIFLFFSIRRFLLFRGFNRAKFNNEYATKIECKSIRFITYTRIRGVVDVIGIIFIDMNRQKYVYVLTNGLISSKAVRSEVRQQCVGKTVELICYNDTKLIKTVMRLNYSLT